MQASRSMINYRQTKRMNVLETDFQCHDALILILKSFFFFGVIRRAISPTFIRPVTGFIA